MYRYLSIFVMAAAELSLASCATVQRTAPIVLSDGDIVWIMNAADTNNIERGRLAEARSGNPKVQGFGRTMIADHRTLLKDSVTLSQRFSIKPVAPALGVELMEKHEAAVKFLEEKSGTTFDRAYLDYEIEMHTRLVDLAGKAARTVNHVALKAYLRQAKPQLQNHLETARTIRQNLVAQTN
jgi:putative membrane protein